jgi:hypothetical protein
MVVMNHRRGRDEWFGLRLGIQVSGSACAKGFFHLRHPILELTDFA